MKKIIGSILFLFLAALSFGQNDEKIEMADAFYESGKIYVVVAVLLIIFAGIVIFLVNIERKIRKLEKEIEQRK